MTKNFKVYLGICFFLLAFPSIMFAQIPNWHSDVLIENNAGFDGFYPQVAMSGNNVVAVWYQLGGSGNYRIYSNYSSDGGVTWGSAQLIENNAGFNAYSPQVAMSGNNVVAVWMQLDGSDNSRIYSNYSTNGGATWNAAQLIDDHPGFSAGFPQVAMSGTNVVVVWEQQEQDTPTYKHQRIYSDYSTDGGATWHADCPLEHNIGHDGWFPQVAMSGNNVVAVWYQADASNMRIYSNYSSDGGETWGSDQPINTGKGYVPEVAISGLNVVAVWAGYVGSGGPFRIYSNYSSDGGATWGPDQLIENNAGVPIGGYNPQVAISGSNTVAVWQQYDGTTNRVYSNYSSNGGATWGSDQLIEDNAGLSGGFPQVAVSGSYVVAVWRQSDGSTEESTYRIHSNYSTDGGATWGSDQLIENNEGFYGEHPQVTFSGGNIVVVWAQSDGSGNRIYSNYATFEAGNNGIPDQCVPTGQSFPCFDADSYVIVGTPPFSWAWSGNVNLTVTKDADNVFCITYPAGWTGSETITFTVTDANGITKDDTATFTVDPVPVVGGIPDQTAPFPPFDLDNYLSGINPAMVTWSYSGSSCLQVAIDGNNVVTVTNPGGICTNPETITFTAKATACGAEVSGSDAATFTPNRPPVVTDAYATPSCLWPPNNKMVSISILGVTDPEGNPVTLTISRITSDEATASEKGAGGANHAPDASGVGTGNAMVRAERSGLKDGRVYVISFTARDSKGATSTGQVLVKVPHDWSDKACPAVDSGQKYDATQIN
jgi:hypothetical protein